MTQNLPKMLADRRISPIEYEDLAHAAALDMSDGTADLVMTSLIFNLMRTSNRIVRDFEVTVYNTAELSWAGYQLLYTLKSIGPTHPKSLARIAGVSTASISSLLNTMTKKNLVTRTPDPDDGRRQIVALTEEGNEILQVMYRENQDREEAWGEALTREEKEQMVALLQKMLIHRPRPHRRYP